MVHWMDLDSQWPEGVIPALTYAQHGSLLPWENSLNTPSVPQAHTTWPCALNGPP